MGQRTMSTHWMGSMMMYFRGTSHRVTGPFLHRSPIYIFIRMLDAKVGPRFREGRLRQTYVEGHP